MSLSPKDLVGVYNFEHAGGTFDVHLRAHGPDGWRFFAPAFQAKSIWFLMNDELKIDWGKYGKYTLQLKDKGTKYFEGSADGRPESWRKMGWKRAFTTAEMMLFDSEWDFQHPGGNFPVKFKADSYNHFVCDDFPAHSHWKLLDDASPTPTVYINWGKFGEYELVISEDGMSMSGSAKGNAANWRKATRMGGIDAGEDANSHNH